MTKKHVSYTHDLLYLAEIAEIDLNSKQKKSLEEITKFNIKTRYDNAKWQFYKTCNKFYAEKYFKISEDLYLWLKKFYRLK